jgi:hypothetical protein
MNGEFREMRNSGFTALMFFLAASPLAAGDALQILTPDKAGIRGGGSVNRKSEGFRQLELAVGYHLPWQWTLAEKWRFETGLDGSAGWLTDGDEDAAIISTGPVVEFRRVGVPLALAFGWSPTYISNYEFRKLNFGSEIQFTSHVGLNWNITRKVQGSYRIQHMSNGGFASPNPGLNMHILGISWVF